MLYVWCAGLQHGSNAEWLAAPVSKQQQHQQQQQQLLIKFKVLLPKQRLQQQLQQQ
jgi:hypothetical protein